MPHMVLKTPLSPMEIAQAVTKTEYHPESETTVVMLSGFVNPNNGTVIFEVIIEDPTLEQHTALMLRPKRENSDEYTLRASAMGQSRATETFHYAVALIGKWVAELHPDGEIIRQSLSVPV